MFFSMSRISTFPRHTKFGCCATWKTAFVGSLVASKSLFCIDITHRNSILHLNVNQKEYCPRLPLRRDQQLITATINWPTNRICTKDYLSVHFWFLLCENTALTIYHAFMDFNWQLNGENWSDVRIHVVYFWFGYTVWR